MATEPLYQRVERGLRAQIADGTWAPGDFLPNEQQLCERYRVSRTTVRTAVGRLVLAGLVVIDRGNGTRVVQPCQPPAQGLISFSRTIRAQGHTPMVRGSHVCLTDRSGHWPTTDPWRPRESSVHLSRVHIADDEAISFSESWVPASLLAGVDLAELSAGVSLYDALAGLGLEVVEVVDSLGVVPASEPVAAHLDVPAGTSLLSIDRLANTAHGRTVETGRILVRTDRYQPTVITRK